MGQWERNINWDAISGRVERSGRVFLLDFYLKHATCSRTETALELLVYLFVHVCWEAFKGDYSAEGCHLHLQWNCSDIARYLGKFTSGISELDCFTDDFICTEIALKLLGLLLLSCLISALSSFFLWKIQLRTASKHFSVGMIYWQLRTETVLKPLDFFFFLLFLFSLITSAVSRRTSCRWEPKIKQTIDLQLHSNCSETALHARQRNPIAVYLFKIKPPPPFFYNCCCCSVNE